MERDTSLGILANNGIISTHTLTWSVTEIIIRNIAKIGISTHTLTWSVTDAADSTKVLNDISTHTLTWSVTKNLIVFFISPQISTHTLTWSVTQEAQRRDYKEDNFNSHAHVERDFLSILLLSKTIQFQLTRSRGA